MAYFESFPKLLFDFSIEGEEPNNIIVTDILRRVQITSDKFRAPSAFEVYTIMENETPEIVSMKYYGTMEYHWLILMVNNLVYGLDSFPKNYYDLENYVTTLYGEDARNDIHHYEDDDGNIVNAIVSGDNLKIFNPVTMVWDLIPTSTYTAVTNYEYEDAENEKRRNIYLLRPEYVRSVITTMNKLLVE
ncbi:MAG: hypothetical protein PHG08_00300 [Bacilli bacterium]|nr:hypothetical protein [Bacilli bacterium]